MSHFRRPLPLFSYLTGTALSAAIASAQPAPPGIRPYCGMSFAILLAADEEVQARRVGEHWRYRLHSRAGAVAIAEGETAIPAGAVAMRSQRIRGISVTPLRRANRNIGYLFGDRDQAMRTLVLGGWFSSIERDRAFLARFDFRPTHSRTCAVVRVAQ